MAADSFDNVDMADPCAVAPKLEEVLNRLVAGQMVVMTRFGEDETRWQPSDIPALERRIAQLRAACAAKTTGRRARYATRGRMRPY